MVKYWHSRLRIGAFPFYYVQIVPNNVSDKSSSKYLREAQLKALDAIPNSGMAVTFYIGSVVSIHSYRNT